MNKIWKRIISVILIMAMFTAASALLLNTNMKIYEIADSIGFSGQFAFSVSLKSGSASARTHFGSASAKRRNNPSSRSALRNQKKPCDRAFLIASVLTCRQEDIPRVPRR